MFLHIDPGFINQRLCLLALNLPLCKGLLPKFRSERNNIDRMLNGHFLVTALLDCCEVVGAPTLLEAVRLGKPRQLFRSTERLTPCPEIYEAARVSHDVELNVDVEKPVKIAYHTKHLVSDTGKMVLAAGAMGGHTNSIIGLLHDRPDSYEIQPLVIGAPSFEHPRNDDDTSGLEIYDNKFGELLPEDIEQFAKMREVDVRQGDEWMTVMRSLSEKQVKESIVELLAESSKKDWGGEQNDHFSGNVIFNGKRRTAAFMFKGPGAGFREMTINMCGKKGDQIVRLVNSKAELSVVQHCHQIGTEVRQMLQSLVVYPGNSRRKYCLIDGIATYKILKAYSLV